MYLKPTTVLMVFTFAFVLSSTFTVGANEPSPLPEISHLSAYATSDSILSGYWDSGFTVHLDISLVGAAIRSRDSALLADLSLQLAEGERVLQRQHVSGVTSADLLKIAVRLAADNRDQQTLERLMKSADRFEGHHLSDQIASLAKLGANSRSPAQSLNIALDALDLDTFVWLKSLLREIEEADLIGDPNLLDGIEWKLNDAAGLSDSQRDALVESVSSIRQSIANGQASPPPIARLVAASRESLWSWSPPPSVKVELLVDGQPLPFAGVNRPTFALVDKSVTERSVRFSKAETEYSIRITNLGSYRVLAVVSVDGLSAMSRRPATAEDGGYIIRPDESYTITGWRLDNSSVRAFTVTSPSESEAAKHGLAHLAGTISVTAIAEDVPWHLGSQPRLAAGTGAGRQMTSAVVSVPFQRSRSVAGVRIRYDVASASLHR